MLNTNVISSDFVGDLAPEAERSISPQIHFLGECWQMVLLAHLKLAWVQQL